MKKKFLDPVNYSLTGNEPKEQENFNEFLDHLTDVPESLPLNSVLINEAGITNQRIYTTISSLVDNDKKVPVFCDVELSVGLSGHRGIHMSRCEEALNEASELSYFELDEFALKIAELLIEKQKSESSYVKVTGHYINPSRTRVTNRTSHDIMYIHSNVSIEDQTPIIQTGLTVFNITACPCTRTYTKFSVVPKLRELGLDTDMINNVLDTVLTGTHTQRGTTTVLTEKASNQVTTAAILETLSENVHLVNELLKRPDEHDLVVRALRKPQFTEDVVRDVALGIYEKFHRNVPLETPLSIESILNDSIHIHDVRTKIDTTYQEIGEQLKNS